MAGDCYEAAMHYLLDHALGAGVKEPNHDLRLVHGEVAGQGPLTGVTFGHAWIEDGDTVIDQSNGRDIRMPRSLYYALGGIGDINNTHVYTPEEARDRVLQHKIYGPWDLKGKHPAWQQGPTWEPDEDDEDYWEDDGGSIDDAE